VLFTSGVGWGGSLDKPPFPIASTKACFQCTTEF
jgi:hypothetical protein